MKYSLFVTVLIILFNSFVTAQESSPKPYVVKEYSVSSDVNAVFNEPIYHPHQEFGLKIACDMSGRLYFLDYEKMNVHILEDENYSIIKTYLVKPYPFGGRFYGDNNGIYYVSSFGFFEYIRFDGQVVFYGDLEKIMIFTDSMRIESFFYHANILFFMDSNNQIHSIINPGMDTAQNKSNYRNPEQTQALFQEGSEIDLKGLTIGEKGLFFLDGLYVGPYFQPIVGKWRYTVSSLGSDASRVSVSSLTQRLIRFSIERAHDHETPEGFAVHPSGDIYILRYDRIKKAHVLFRIDNTWDPAARQAYAATK